MSLFDANGDLFIALGKTIIHSFWIGLLILAMLRTALHSIPGKHAHLRYLFSVVSMLILAGSVTATFFLIYAPVHPGGKHLWMLESLKIVPPIMVPESASEPAWTPNLLFLLCSYLYFAGLLYMLLRSTISFRYIRGLRKTGTPVHGEWKGRLERISDILDIRRNLSFLQSDRIQGPLLIGILKPVVMVPVGMFTHLSVSQVESILIHELYHLKRGDGLINLIQLLLEAVLFYNPALWFISDIIRREREYSCDDAVVLTSKDPVNYAKALLKLAEQQHYLRLAPGAGGSKRHHLSARVIRIINQKQMKKNTHDRIKSLLLFAGALILVLAISSFSGGFSISKQMDGVPKENHQVFTQAPLESDIPLQDTIREPEEPLAPKEPEELDWDQIKKDMEAARLEAMENIDWDQIKAEMDSVIQDFDADFDMDFDVDIDMESIRDNIEQARMEMEEIDWEEMKEEIERGLSEIKIDVEEVKKNIEESFRNMDSPKLEKDM
jgi:beta-lactamase regulating signal transducer with metallopeptidase domain